MAFHRVRASCIAVAAAAFSCGGSVRGEGSGLITASGQVGGMPLPTADAIGIPQSLGSGATMLSGVGVVITNQGGTCALLQSADAAAPGNRIIVNLTVTVPGAMVPAGSYPIRNISCTPPSCPPSGYAIASYVASDANCNVIEQSGAASGSVVVKSVTPTAVEGGYDLLMDTGDHVTGQFTAPVCAFDLNTFLITHACR